MPALQLQVSGEGKSAVDVGPAFQGGIGAQNFYFGGNPTAAKLFDSLTNTAAGATALGIPPWFFLVAGGVALVFLFKRL
jgi:hypothetical protein